jgi:predicted secreted hydrolase
MDKSFSISLPSADGVQPEHVCQWWYWSGQLRSQAGRRYGFQVAFFTAEAIRGVLWGQMAHWALVDIDAGRFTNGSRIWLGAPQRIEGRFTLSSPGGEVSAVGGGGRDRLRLRSDGLELDLLASGGPVAVHYQGSAHEYGFGGYSYYYSRPRMIAEATLRREHASEAVRGEVWFDRQYGDLSCALAEGWQWLSMHLESGEQLMVFGFNRDVGERFASITDTAGSTRWLAAHELRLEPLEHWRSPRSGIEYPCAWRLRTDAHELEIRASLREQEMNGTRWWGPVYWEGACEVVGSHRGLAYVELLGSLGDFLHAPGNRPYSAFGLRAGSLRVPWAEPLHAPGNRPYSAFGLRAGSLRVPRAEPLHAPGNRPYSAFGLRARPQLQGVLRHPTVTLGLATAVGWVAGRVPGLRPRFPNEPVPDELEHWREAVGQ